MFGVFKEPLGSISENEVKVSEWRNWGKSHGAY
jgi:hypothetical protein